MIFYNYFIAKKNAVK